MRKATIAALAYKAGKGRKANAAKNSKLRAAAPKGHITVRGRSAQSSYPTGLPINAVSLPPGAGPSMSSGSAPAGRSVKRSM